MYESAYGIKAIYFLSVGTYGVMKQLNSNLVGRTTDQQRRATLWVLQTVQWVCGRAHDYIHHGLKLGMECNSNYMYVVIYNS